MAIINEQLDYWLEKWDSNLEAFLKSKVYKKEKRLEFIRNQYKIISATEKVLHGKARLDGIKPIKRKAS